MSGKFDLLIGIDYSGAQTPTSRLKALQVYAAKPGAPPGARVGRRNEFRLCERWSSSAKSVFQFDVQGTVAKSTHDAYAVTRWLAESAARGVLGRYFDPPLTIHERSLAAREGWILGIS